MNKIGYVIRDFFVFILILIVSRFVLRELDLRMDALTAVIFLFVSTIGYAVLVNRKFLLSILYGFMIFLIHLYLIDHRLFPDNWYLLGLILMISYLFYALKKHREETSILKNPKEINLSDFSKIGYAKIKDDFFQIGKELNLPRNSYKMYKPTLKSKLKNDNEDLILNYSNDEDLNFVLMISKKNEIFVIHKKNKKYSKSINDEILKLLKASEN